MAYFPRRGVELTSDAEVLFPQAEYDRPAVVVKMANGARQARYLTQTSAYSFTVTLRVNDTDFQTLMEFIEEHGTVVPFTLVHPDYGEGTAYIASARIQIEKIVRGNPSWRRVEIPIEGQH